MSNDDQQFLDLLASVPSRASHYSDKIADYIEKHTNAIAADIRDALDQASWLPERLKPPRQAHFFAKPPPPPASTYQKCLGFLQQNATTIAVVCAFTATTFYLVNQRKRAHARKRRARRLANGQKREIVVLISTTFHDPLTRLVALELERRGYIVYVTVNNTEEDSLVQRESRSDLRSLWIDITSTVPNPAYDTHPDLDPIRQLLSPPSEPLSPNSRHPSPHRAAQQLILSGIVLFPGTSSYPTAPLSTLHPSTLADSISTRLTVPVQTLQQFLPLLARHATDKANPASVVIAYPSIPASLNPPGELASALIASSLSTLTTSLRRDLILAGSNISVHELRLGNFDLGNTYTRNLNHHLSSHAQSSALTALQRAQHSSRTNKTVFRATSTRELHNTIFDCLAPAQIFRPFNNPYLEWQVSKPGRIFVGSGARAYHLIGSWLPSGIVGWMMGYRRRKEHGIWPRGRSLFSNRDRSSTTRNDTAKKSVLEKDLEEGLGRLGSHEHCENRGRAGEEEDDGDGDGSAGYVSLSEGMDENVWGRDSTLSASLAGDSGELDQDGEGRWERVQINDRYDGGGGEERSRGGRFEQVFPRP